MMIRVNEDEEGLERILLLNEARDDQALAA